MTTALDDAVQFAGIARVDTASLISTTAEPTVPADDWCADAAGNSYVDIVELDEALDLYYAGDLDKVSAANCCNELRKLIPGKPLISQLDTAGMTAAIAKLDSADGSALRCYHIREADRSGDTSTYADALQELSEVIHKAL